MARKSKIGDAVFLILDVGSTDEDDQTSKSSFLERSKEVLIKLIERRLFGQTNDLVSLILMNTERTENDLANLDDDNGYEHISVISPLQFPTWDLIRYVNKIKPTGVNEADWLDAMTVALDLLKKEKEEKNFRESKLVFLTRLAGALNDDQATAIIEGVKSLNAELHFLGHDLDDIQEFSQEPDITSNPIKEQLMDALILLGKIRDEIGQEHFCIMDFDSALSQLVYFKGKSVNPFKWQVTLEIGSLIQFDVHGYKLIAEQDKVAFKQKKIGDAGAEVYKDVKHIVSDQDGKETEVSADDIISSFTYGSTIIPFSSVDKEMMSYKSGPKSLKLIGFTPKKRISKHILLGNGVYAFTCGSTERDAASFAAFVEALESQKMVGIVRRVYSRDSAPSIGTLYPETVQDKKVLIFIELPFAEDEVKLKFPSFKDVIPTENQKNAVNNLIDALDLDNHEDPDEALFQPENVFDPGRQFTYYCMSYRVLHPDEPVPKELPEHIKALLHVPPEMEKEAEAPLEEIRKLFPLEETENNPGNKTSVFNQADENDIKDEALVSDPASIQSTSVATLFQSAVVQVGTQQPVRDFITLLEKGEDHTEVCNQMKKVIFNLIQKTNDDLQKPIEAMQALRSSCLEKNYKLYNNWLPELKYIVTERNLKFFWDQVAEGNLGLITNVESKLSDVSKESATEFFKITHQSEEYEKEMEIVDDDLLNDL